MIPPRPEERRPARQGSPRKACRFQEWLAITWPCSQSRVDTYSPAVLLRHRTPKARWLARANGHTSARSMLINLLPDFLAVLESANPVPAYHRYIQAQRSLLEAYWHNYVIEPTGPHFEEVVRETVRADRADLRTILDRTDVVALARETAEQCQQLFEVDSDIDVVLMVGVGAANAGELVVDGRGIAFVCLEHFTSVVNPTTRGLGLDPELIPMWLAHEIAHCVRYTSPQSRSELRQLVAAAGGYYSFWDTGRGASLREHLVNEGLAVQASRRFSPGHAPWEYFGYARKQYARIRELEPVIARAVADDLGHSGLGLRLRYLSGGMSDESRTVHRYIIPERAGYFLGARMVEDAIAQKGLPFALRASAPEITSLADNVRTA